MYQNGKLGAIGFHGTWGAALSPQSSGLGLGDSEHTYKLLNGSHSLLVGDDLREDGVFLKELQGLLTHPVHTQGLCHTGGGGERREMDGNVQRPMEGGWGGGWRGG